MSKCVANLYRYVEICLGANQRYLDALASVDDPGPSRRELKEPGTRVTRKGRTISGFNPAQPETAKLFKAVLNGDYMIQGFRNADIRESLFGRVLQTTSVCFVQEHNQILKNIIRVLWP